MSIRGPVKLQVWYEVEAEPRPWMWSVDITGTGKHAKNESLALFGPRCKEPDAAKKLAERRVAKFIESLVRALVVK